MKAGLYEGGIRTPFLVRWPGKVPAGKVNDSVVSAVDIFPTLCSLARVAAPNPAEFDGEDRSVAFRGGSIARTKALFWEYGRKPAPKGTKTPFAFPYPKEPDAKSPNVAMRDGDWKLLVNADGTDIELYNLATDPNESKNIATENPDIAKRMVTAALNWRKSLP